MIGHWRRLLHATDETSLAGLVIEICREQLGHHGVAVILQAGDGRFELQQTAGLKMRHVRTLGNNRLTRQNLADLRKRSRLGGSVGCVDDYPFCPGLGPVVLVWLADADGVDMGLILLSTSPEHARPFSRERATLEMLGYAVSVAFLFLCQRRAEEARIRTIETQKHQLEALLQASANVHRLDLDDVLQRIAVSMTTDGGFQRAAVYLRDDDDMLHARAFVGVPAEDVERVKAPVPFARFAYLMHADMQISRSFLFDHRKHQLPPELIASLSIPPDRSAETDEWHPLDSLTIPLQDRGGRTIGLVSMDEPDDGHYPNLDKIQMLELFAGACAVAVEQARLYDEIQRLAATDSLTGLHNRRSFDDALRRATAHSQRGDFEFSLLFCDLDGLKRLNDSLGHEVGDRILQEVADVLRVRLRKSDLAARIGGDEFAVLLPDTDLAGAAVLAEDLRGAVGALGPPGVPRGIRLSISVGVASSGATSSLSPAQLLAAADHALYAAKEDGRDRVRVA
jgi:diguanylate cyclase (GGDEF)-like protein